MSERIPLATTFRPDEVRALVSLLAKLRSSGIAVAPPVVRVERKFLRMREKLDDSPITLESVETAP